MDTLSSDHLPITISMTRVADMGSSAPATRFKYESADWDRFHAELGSVDIDQPDLENVNSRIVSSLLEAVARHDREATPGETKTARRPSEPNESCTKSTAETKRLKHRKK